MAIQMKFLNSLTATNVVPDSCPKAPETAANCEFPKHGGPVWGSYCKESHFLDPTPDVSNLPTPGLCLEGGHLPEGRDLHLELHNGEPFGAWAGRSEPGNIGRVQQTLDESFQEYRHLAWTEKKSILQHPSYKAPERGPLANSWELKLGFRVLSLFQKASRALDVVSSCCSCYSFAFFLQGYSRSSSIMQPAHLVLIYNGEQLSRQDCFLTSFPFFGRLL